MKATLAIILTLFGLQAHAQGTASFVGTDSKEQECSVSIDANNNIVSYRYINKDGVGDGYGFTMTEDFKNSLKQNQSPVSINEGGLGGATLKIWINADGTLKAKFRNLLIIGSSCENMQRKQ